LFKYLFHDAGTAHVSQQRLQEVSSVHNGERGKKIGTECRNSVIVSYSLNPTMFDRVSKPGPSGQQTANHKAKFLS